MQYPKPLPHPSQDSRPFWDACRAHELRLPRCQSCGRFHFYPRSFCPYCTSKDLEWVKASGRGQVYTFSVVRLPFFGKEWEPDIPYAVALIELDEGVRMVSNVVGCAPESVAVGMGVEVCFDDVTPEVTLPRFRPLARQTSAAAVHHA